MKNEVEAAMSALAIRMLYADDEGRVAIQAQMRELSEVRKRLARLCEIAMES